MDFVKRNVSKWIAALIVLTVGILCIVAGAKLGGSNIKEAYDSLNAISVILGVVLIVIASLALCFALAFVLVFKKSLLITGLSASIVLGVGISLVVAKYAGSLINILITIVPYVLVCVGAVIIVDAVFTLIRAISKKAIKKVLFALICTFLLGTASLVVGFLCMSFGDSDPVIAYNVQLIVFGVLVALYGLLLLVISFVKLPGLTVLVKEE